MYALKFIGVMVGMILADICWAYYFIKITERKSIQSGIWASLIYIFGIFTTTHYIQDITLGIAAIIGSFIGTVIVVEFTKYKESKNG